MPKLKQYVGLDVSLKETSIAVIDENDKLVWRGSVPSTPEGIAKALRTSGEQWHARCRVSYEGKAVIAERISDTVGRPLPVRQDRPRVSSSPQNLRKSLHRN